jgi:hypothetical protein
MILRIIHAHLLTESGRESKRLIPPREIREIPTEESFTFGEFALLVADRDMAIRCLWPAGCPVVLLPSIDHEPLRIQMYNGGLEPQWIEHGQRIAGLVML